MCIVAMMLAVGAALMPSLAQAAATKPKKNDPALKAAIVACKAEAKGKKVKWLGRRKYVNRCVADQLQDRPKMDIIRVLKDHPDMKDLPSQEWDAM
jgi:hypothetical protein